MLEAVCFQTREVLDAMKADSGVELGLLKVDGGMCVNDRLMQIQADLLGVEVVRPVMVETTGEYTNNPVATGCDPLGMRFLIPVACLCSVGLGGGGRLGCGGVDGYRRSAVSERDRGREVVCAVDRSGGAGQALQAVDARGQAQHWLGKRGRRIGRRAVMRLCWGE